MHQVKSSKTPTHVSIPSAVFRPLGKWCVSKGDLDKIRFEWNIQQFALLTADQTYKSTEFRGKEGPTKLRLDLCVYRNNLVRVKLYGVASDKCRIKIAILNQRREDVTQLEKKANQIQEHMVLTITRTRLVKAYNSLLSDGICFEIEKRID
jgi:hypothetical protein